MKHAITILFSALLTNLTLAQEPAKTATSVPLFDGKSLSGWTNNEGKAPGAKWEAKDGILHLTEKGGGDLWTEKRFGNFVLEIEYKTTGNSGVYFRTDDRKNNIQTGLEVQVERPSGPDKHSVGCLYDLQAPTKNVGKDNDWNKYKITCEGAKITVELNGQKVNEVDLDKWTEAGKNPDGTANKYKSAVKDWKREGHIGLQDHGHEVWYRNITVTPLK